MTGVLSFFASTASACNVVGKWELQNNSQVLIMNFNESGYVAVTMGNKNGPLAAPIYTWNCKKGVLRIIDEKGSIIKELSKIKLEGRNVTATNRDGKIEKYIQ